MKVIKVIFIVIVIIILIIGVPIIINECYKLNCGYITVWDGTDVLGYYGTILGSVISVATLVITIRFTKKQIQRESYLQNEREKLSNLKSIFLEILDSINPILTLKNVIDNGFNDPSKAINILQKYQMNCKTACDQLNAHLNISDYPKFKKLIDSIADISEELIRISQAEITQYSNLRFWKHRETALKITQNEKALPGSFSKEDIAFSNDILEKTKDVNYEDIEKEIAKLNSEFIAIYEKQFRALLQLNGTTFEELQSEVQQRADKILHLIRKNTD